MRRGDRDAVLTLALRARQEALAGTSATAYLGATRALATRYDADGNRAAAYEALAVGWVTLADLLGPDLARQAFQPQLLELHGRWGAEAFAAIRREYEARRQADIKEGKP